MQGQKKMELVLYVVLWAILFAAAALSVFVDSISPTPEEILERPMPHTHGYDLMGLFSTWRLLTMFCVTFFIHNFFIAPLLVYRNRKWRYGILATLLTALFSGYMMSRTLHTPGPESHPRGMMEHRPGLRQGAPPPGDTGATHPPFEMRKEHDPMKDKPFGGPTAVAIIIMLLLLGLNVATKYYFKSLDDRKRMKELEHENLSQRLHYLKYQINPHFFMNTLNNIHALVDIDQEEAKVMIETLSKLMRYVLYDNDKPMASLQDELGFLGHYIDLMRIRYNDNVRISVSMPEQVPEVKVPSLLFVTFVENAFKHGVSCRQASFIEVGVSIDLEARQLCFLCNNSKKPEAEESAPGRNGSVPGKKRGGVGLQNAIQRLKLIYNDEYELKIETNDTEYSLTLRLPFR